MKPYGRERNVKGFPAKVDYHIHSGNRKVGSWWEDYSEKFSKKQARQNAKKEIRRCTHI
jgi:hypothetical protein